jgi:heptosyltransferase-2
MKKKSPARRRTVSVPDCLNFTGYKPCHAGTDCLDECADPRPRGKEILIVNLEAMGNVLVTTTLLPALKRKYPKSTIRWITLKNAAPLLAGNPFVEKVYTWDPENWLILQAMRFDVAINVDKSVRAGAFMKALDAKTKLGYGIDAHGVIVPLNPEAQYNYRLGLDDQLKFRVNQKPNPQLLAEAVGLRYKRDEYVLTLSKEEQNYCDRYRQEHGLHDARLVVGFNTGCSLLYPNKKLSVEQHVVLIRKLASDAGIRLLLLGGPEDTERNAEIARQVGSAVLNTPSTEGVRRGICYENVCDLVVSGDSFGMHVAIALKKFVIAWFGVSCPPEIDLYDRGVKLIPEGLACSPCWKHECPYNLECIQMVDLDRIVQEIRQFTKPPAR